MPQRKPSLAPARYVGHEPVRLLPRPGGYLDGDGRLRTGADALLLKPGETLMLPEPELRGQTFLTDPTGLAAEAEWLGVGFTPLPEHAGLTRVDLIGLRFPARGGIRQYEFHDGRSDFQEVDAPWPPVSEEGAAMPSDTSSADVPATDAQTDAQPARRAKKGAETTPAATEATSDSAETPAQGE